MTEFTNIQFSTQTKTTKKKGTLSINNNNNDNAGLDFKSIGSDGKPRLVHIDNSNIELGLWLQNYDSYTLKLTIKTKEGNTKVRFTGFKRDAYDSIEQLFKTIDKPLTTQQIATKGSNVGSFSVDEHNMSFMIDNKLAFDVGLNNIVQTVVQGRNELAFEFIQNDENNISEQLYEMRVWVCHYIRCKQYMIIDDS